MGTRKNSLCFAIAAGLILLATGCSEKKESGHENEYVDLGLSVKWATCNVGATAPEEYGNYYAWGEVLPKTDYGWESYRYCYSTEDSMTKYCTDSKYGIWDNQTTLEAMDDAATYNWGDSWRMPTAEEWLELQKQCAWTWKTRNGVNGYEVTSKINGNSIFLPAAGFPNNTDLYYANAHGYYWFSSLFEGGPHTAWYISINSGCLGRGYDYRYIGQSVRPVCP